MTDQELMDNYEFKIIERMIKREYPFVKKIVPSEGHELYKSLLFLDAVIDATKLFDYMKVAMPSYFPYMINSSTYGGSMATPYLTTFFQDDEHRPIAKDIQDKISSIITKTHKSSALPTELKLKRKPEFGGFILQLK